jgi:nucleoid DNA-binding protein
VNKKEFILSLTEDHKILREDASKITDVVFSQIRKQLLKGREVRIDEVGCFAFKFKKPGTVNNNITGTQHDMGPRVRMKFKVFPSMQKALNAILAKEMASEYDASKRSRKHEDDDNE